MILFLATQHTSSSPKQTNSKHRDDHQILERLAQQANKFNINERSNLTREHRPFRNLESALSTTSHQHVDRHGKRTGIPESEVRFSKTSLVPNPLFNHLFFQ